MDLALNNLQWLICHKTKSNQFFVFLPLTTKVTVTDTHPVDRTYNILTSFREVKSVLEMVS